MQSSSPSPFIHAKPKPFYKKWWFTALYIIVILSIVGSALGQPGDMKIQKENSPTEEDLFEGIFKEEDSDITINNFSPFTSKKFGFSVLYPETPNESIIDLPELTTHGFQVTKAHSETEPIQYNVFYTINENGKILDDDSISVVLNNQASMKASQYDGNVIEDRDIVFQGFNAREYTFTSKMYGLDFIHKGIVFVVDGDTIELTVLYPDSVKEDSVKYEDWKKSFQLKAIESELAKQDWSNKIVKFTPPNGWIQSTIKAGSRVVGFANDIGYSLELYEVKVGNQQPTCREIKNEFGEENVDSQGYMYRIFNLKEYTVDFKTITKCIENSKKTYILIGKSLEATFFRFEIIFKKVFDTFMFE